MNINSYHLDKPAPVFHNHRSTTKLVSPLLGLIAGTGGLITAHSAEVLDHCIYNSRIHIERSASRNVDIRSPSEHVANIRDTFALNMSELATVLHITRPTVYAWLEGQEPKPEAVTQIQQLSRAADEIKRMKISRFDTLLRRPILNGHSLLDILKAGGNPLEALAELKLIAERESQVRLLPKSSGKRLRSLDDVIGEFPVITNERS